MKKGKKILIKLPDKIPLVVGEFYSWAKFSEAESPDDSVESFREFKVVLEKSKINSNFKKQKPEKSKPKKLKQELKKTKKKIEKKVNPKLLTKNKNKKLTKK